MGWQFAAIALTGLSSIVWLPVVGAPYARFAVTLLAGAFWLVVWAEGTLEKLDSHRKLLFVALGLCAASVVISAANSQFPGLEFTYGGATGVSAPYWIALIVIVGLSSRVTLGKATLTAIAWQYVWVVPVAIIGGAQSLFLGRASFGFANVDLLAPMMLLFAPTALALGAKYPDRAVLWRTIAAILFVTVLVTRTLAGLFGLGAELLFLAWFTPTLIGLRANGRVLVIASLTVALIAFMTFGSLYVHNELSTPTENFASEKVLGASSVTRVEMWRVGAEIWKHRLLTGVGPDGYAFEGQQYFGKRLFLLEHYPAPDEELPMDPHSLVVLLPVDFGILGTLAALLLAFAWGRGVMSPPFKSSEGHLLRWSFAIGCLGFGYAALFTPFPLLYGGVPAMMAGLALVRPTDPRPWPDTPRISHPGRFAAVAAVVLALALGGATVTSWGVFVQASNSGSLTSSDSALRVASRIQPQVFYYRYLLLHNRGELIRRGSTPDVYRKYQLAVDNAPIGVKGYAPYLVELVRLSIRQAESSRRNDLTWEMARLADAEKIGPSLPEVGIERAHALIAAGEYAKARTELDSMMQWRGSTTRWEQYDTLLRSLAP